MEPSKNPVVKKKVLILIGVITAAVIVLAVIGMIIYDKASTYVISKTIVEFGKMYDDLTPEEKQKIEDFINSIEIPADMLASDSGTAAIVAQNPGSSTGSEDSGTQGSPTDSPVANTSGNSSTQGGGTVNSETSAQGSSDSTGQSAQGGTVNSGIAALELANPDGTKRSVNDIAKMVTTEDKNKIISIILSKMTLDEALNAFMSFGGKMSGEKFEAFKEEMKDKFTPAEIYTIKEMYVKYMNAI